MADSKKQRITAIGKDIKIDASITHVHNDNPLTSEQFKRIIQLERKDAIEECTKASDAEKVKLEQKIAELDRRLADVPKAFQEFKERIARLESILEREGNEIGNKKLVEARDALEKGDFSKADELFAEIEAREELAVKRSARAAFARGEIAEQEIRWYDAVEHYTRAAHLNPCFENLISAQKLTFDVGTYDSSLSFGLDAQKVAIKEHGEKSNQYATSLNNLANVYLIQKQYKEAEPLLKEALKIIQDIFGKKTPEVAMSLNNLGGMYQEKKQYREATYFFKRAFNISKETLGVKHTLTATTLNNLGGTYNTLGEFRTAKPLLKQALKIRKEILGDNHPDTANSYNILGGLYANQGHYAKAEPYLWQALEILEMTLGPDHPDTIWAKGYYEENKKALATTQKTKPSVL